MFWLSCFFDKRLGWESRAGGNAQNWIELCAQWDKGWAVHGLEALPCLRGQSRMRCSWCGPLYITQVLVLQRHGGLVPRARLDLRPLGSRVGKRRVEGAKAKRWTSLRSALDYTRTAESTRLRILFPGLHEWASSPHSSCTRGKTAIEEAPGSTPLSCSLTSQTDTHPPSSLSQSTLTPF